MRWATPSPPATRTRAWSSTPAAAAQYTSAEFADLAGDYLLSDPDARYTDLGSDFYNQRMNPERRKRAHVHQLEALGYKVTLEPAA